MGGQLILCHIPGDFRIGQYLNDIKYFDEVEQEDIARRKTEIIEIVGYLKTTGFYSGEELEHSPFILDRILQDQKLVVKELQKTGEGIDILNIFIPIHDWYKDI